MEASLLTNLFLSAWNDSWVLSNVRRMRMGGEHSIGMNTLTEILMKRTCELFQDWSWGATANVSQWFDSSSKYMGLLWKDQKMLILSLLRKHDNASNIEKQESVCPADGVTNRYSIWIDPIEKFTSNGMWRIIADSLHDYTRRGYCSAAKFSAAKFTYGYFRNYFRGRIFTPSKREWVRATPLQHGSTWCGFKGSVVKMRVDEPLSKWLQLEKLSS